jgi:hypothetical protein
MEPGVAANYGFAPDLNFFYSRCFLALFLATDIIYLYLLGQQYGYMGKCLLGKKYIQA